MNKEDLTLKTYKTIDEQIEYLRENKKIIVDEEDKHWFKDINYISMINPYKELFSNGKDAYGNHIYTTDVNFKEILSSMKIDLEFSNCLYKDIRKFEQKFKNAVIATICNKYAKDEDKYCLNYINEIKIFLYDFSTMDFNKIKTSPTFCKNISNQLSSNGYVNDGFGIEKKVDLLRKILAFGTGISVDGADMKKANILAKHYLDTCQMVPLWVIPNMLTLGEVSMLFLMMDIDMQNIVCQEVAGFSLITENDKPEYTKLLRFSTKLEIIRKMRNTINHYEPFFPLLGHNISKLKLIKNSPIINTLEFLNPNFKIPKGNDFYKSETFLNINIKINPNNVVKIRLLELMMKYIEINKFNDCQDFSKIKR